MVYRSLGREEGESYYDHYLRVCLSNGFDPVPSLDRMIVCDYLLANGDRHMGNFGILRDPDTLEWIGAAPLFDNGGCLGADEHTERILKRSVFCQPFLPTFDRRSDW